jgi:hypothetical protein
MVKKPEIIDSNIEVKFTRAKECGNQPLITLQKMMTIINNKELDIERFHYCDK